MMLEIDARGFACPIPVIKTKKAMDENPGKPLAIFVETTVAVENVGRLAASRHYSIKLDNLDGGDYCLVLTPQ